jgi:sigma-B regulation protein RsbU (phosphoserine phosphatase)
MARTMTVLEVKSVTSQSPGDALARAARRLVDGNDTCMFATVLVGVLDVRNGHLQLASAGHEPPLHLRADGRRALLPVPTAGPLGVDVADDYPVWTGRLEPGDALLLYTDGVTEAFDAANRAFGEARLLAAVAPAQGPAAMCDAVLAAVQAHANGAAQSDDITLLALRYGEQARE